jgi:uncharacterized membrane protein (UPF0127 family)
MREREEEIKNIHKGMHQVNEIYKVRPMLFFFVTQYQSILWTQFTYTPVHVSFLALLFVQDLAHLVDGQQEGIDQIETQMENAEENTATGLRHIEKANESSQSQCVVS